MSASLVGSEMCIRDSAMRARKRKSVLLRLIASNAKSYNRGKVIIQEAMDQVDWSLQKRREAVSDGRFGTIGGYV
eukprot:3494699-Alexandrium_andersonii.AAC.1